MAPIYVPPLFCNGNRAPLPATYAVQVAGMHVAAVAMDMEIGAVRQLWCATAACQDAVEQTTFAHEQYPHAVVSVLRRVGNSSAPRLVRVLPPQPPPRISTAGAAPQGKCMEWEARASAGNYTVFFGAPVGAGSRPHKGANVTAAVSLLAAPAAPMLRAGDALVLVGSIWTSADAPHGDPVAAALNETRALSAPAVRSRLMEQHIAAYQRRGRHVPPVTVTGNPELAATLNSSWYALAASAPRPEPELNRFGTGMGIATNGYNGRIFWDMDTWMAPTYLLFGPTAAADGCINFRFDEAPIAAECARRNGFAGLDFPWDIAFGATESNVCPEHGAGHSEIHMSGA